MELEDLDEEEDAEEHQGSLSLTRRQHETVTNTATTTSQPLFGNHTLESLSDLNISELLDLNTYDSYIGPRPGDVIARYIGDSRLGLILSNNF